MGAGRRFRALITRRSQAFYLFVIAGGMQIQVGDPI
jgi:hypothetical protein